MKRELAIFGFALLLAGCSTKATRQLKEQNAFLAGQNTALLQQQAASFPTVTVVGPVRHGAVPWVAGLTLAQAIATAEYVGNQDPAQIILTRQGESAGLNPGVLFGNSVVPLEPGDVVELKP